ncbi:MAG: hypothetical protein ACJATT_002422 [Myxococcota bacterium]|jgi:hypothetical protein
MRHLLPLLSLTGCVSQGALVAEPVPREPVTNVTLGAPLQTPLPDGWGNPLAADMDADGIIDLVSMTEDGDVAWMRGDGNGNFDLDILLSVEDLQTRVVEQITGDSSSTTFIDDFDLVDVDGDGVVDLQLTLRFTEAQSFQIVSGVLFSPTRLAAWQTWTETQNHRVTSIGDLDGDGRVEWIEFSQTPAIHTSTGQVWPLTDAVSWVYYPYAGTLLVDGETLFITLVDGGFGISQIETWAVTASGLEPRPSIEGIYAQTAVFGPERLEVADEVMMVSSTGIDRFDGTAVVPAFQSSDDQSFFNPSIGDFTGDGRLDVLIADGTNPARLHASSADNTLVDMAIRTPELPGFDTLAVDINGDGLDDLVQIAWNNGETILSVWMNES